MLDKAPRLVSVTFKELSDALMPLHMHEKRWVDALHDVWKQGAPTPDSIIRNPRDYDERFKQRGNVEKRLLLPTPAAAWIMQVSAARGHPYSYRQAIAILKGEPDYGFDYFRN